MEIFDPFLKVFDDLYEHTCVFFGYGQGRKTGSFVDLSGVV